MAATVPRGSAVHPRPAPLPGMTGRAYTHRRNGCSTKSVVAHEWATRTVGNGLSTAPPPAAALEADIRHVWVKTIIQPRLER
jgi:hypothetical protein